MYYGFFDIQTWRKPCFHSIYIRVSSRGRTQRVLAPLVFTACRAYLLTAGTQGAQVKNGNTVEAEAFRTLTPVALKQEVVTTKTLT